MDKAQILVVEDDNIVVMELKDTLQSLGYAVSAVASYGEEAIGKAAESRPDLVLMDIRLKGNVNGIDAAQEIRERFDIPVVYLTAYADEDTLQRAKITEPYGYIVKPFEERELHSAIEMALYKHKMERKLKERERWIATTLSSIGDAVIATDERGLVRFMNPVAEALTGWKQEDAWGKDLTKVFNVIDEATREVAENPAARVIQEGIVVGLTDHSILIAKDGREIPVDDNVAPIRDHKGNVIGVVLVFRDITERKQVERAIKQRHRELAALLETSQRLASRLDLDELLDEVAHSIVDTLPAAEAASLWLYDEGRDKLVIRAWAGYDDETVSGLALSPDTGLVGLVYSSREPHVIDDIASESVFEVVKRPGLEGARSALGVPLSIEDQCVGALFADSFSRMQAFGENDLRLLQSLAGQAAIVIQNAQLFESVRAGRERLQSLSHRLVEVQEVERRYIARELHDEIGQLLTGLKLALEVSTRLPADAVKAHLGEARALVNELMAKVQELCLNLRPAMLDDLGLLAALLCHFERYTAQTSVQVTFQHTGLEERRFASEVETAAYRIVQEALTNVARHAGISEATVRLWTDQDAIGVQIEDQGAGFDPEAALAAGACNGLAGMRERATLLGGKLTVESVPGAGTRLTAELPLQGRLERRHYERDDYARG